MIYVAVSVSLIPPIVELFSTEKNANLFAFSFKQKTGHTLDVKPREIDVVDITVIRPDKSNG